MVEHQETSERKEGPAYKADNFTAICEPIVQTMWETWRLTFL
jgi:hypothetical protein